MIWVLILNAPGPLLIPTYLACTFLLMKEVGGVSIIIIMRMRNRLRRGCR